MGTESMRWFSAASNVDDGLLYLRSRAIVRGETAMDFREAATLPTERLGVDVDFLPCLGIGKEVTGRRLQPFLCDEGVRVPYTPSARS